MIKNWILVLAFVIMSAEHRAQAPEIQTSYDTEKETTTVRLVPVQIASDTGKYHSLHISPSFSYPGTTFAKPKLIDFELRTIVKGRLSTDLYVVFVIDGEAIFLSSSRWGIKRPVPGRVWMGERLVFRMPYDTLVKFSNAKKAAIKLDGSSFELNDKHKSLLRDFASVAGGP